MQVSNRYGENKNVYRAMEGKSEGKKQSRRPSLNWKHYLIKDFEENLAED